MFPFFFFSFLYLGKAVLYECAGRHKRTVCFVFLLISPRSGNQMVHTGFSLLRLRYEGSFYVVTGVACRTMSNKRSEL
ncbi:hypothetical protein E4U24_006627 [Claviceps purpurea]|nr:hypothetical protein E4U24_006627 [Claviceps purpurea]KAG6257423.1 hypothetical protein E4U23_006084 [Claviceps purpurea]